MTYSLRCLSLLAIGVAILSARVSTQSGPALLTTATYAEAVADGKRKDPLEFVRTPHAPVNWFLRNSNASAQEIAEADRDPFSFRITTPYFRVATMVAMAVQTYAEPKPQTLAAANAGLVQIEVSPGRNFATAQSIERVVIKRGGKVIQATKSTLRQETIRNGFGAQRALNSGTFTFPLETFAPTEPITIVLVGLTNFEWPMSEKDLAALR